MRICMGGMRVGGAGLGLAPIARPPALPQGGRGLFCGSVETGLGLTPIARPPTRPQGVWGG